MKLTKTDAARHLNVSRTTVYNMINRGAIAVDESGLIDVEQLEQVCTPCTGERQEENTNVPVEFRDASPLILGRYVSYLEQELVRVREERNKYIAYLEQQVEFLQHQNKVLQFANCNNEQIDELWRSQILDERTVNRFIHKLRTSIDQLEKLKKSAEKKT
jgi:helix-turn-helix protein